MHHIVPSRRLVAHFCPGTAPASPPPPTLPRYIVQLVEVVRDAEHIYIVMELLNGGELFERILQRDRYTEADACASRAPNRLNGSHSASCELS